MAGLIHKLKASTLIEVITAMAIIMVVFGIAMMIFVNVGKSNNSTFKLHACIKLDQVINLTRKEKDRPDAEFEYDNLKIVRKAEKYEGEDRLVLVTFQAFNKEGKLIVERKEIFRNDNTIVDPEAEEKNL